jgi:RNA polymerase sigma-70 factor (ECF subfamily)
MSALSDNTTHRNEFLSVIFRSDYRWLLDRLRFRLGCKFQAEDVASETFTLLAGLKNIEALREPRAMLTTIAQRVTYEIWRRRDLERAYLDALAHAPQGVHPSPEEQALVFEALHAIDRAFVSLPAKARSAFLYSLIDGMTYAEIGEKLGVSASMVRQYMAQALLCCHEAAGE